MRIIVPQNLLHICLGHQQLAHIVACRAKLRIRDPFFRQNCRVFGLQTFQRRQLRYVQSVKGLLCGLVQQNLLLMFRKELPGIASLPIGNISLSGFEVVQDVRSQRGNLFQPPLLLPDLTGKRVVARCGFFSAGFQIVICRYALFREIIQGLSGLFEIELLCPAIIGYAFSCAQLGLNVHQKMEGRDAAAFDFSLRQCVFVPVSTACKASSVYPSLRESNLLNRA